jgi:hypothetical protein
MSRIPFSLELHSMDGRKQRSPIFEIGVELHDGDLCFLPSIECNSRENGIRDIINNIVNDFISIAI